MTQGDQERCLVMKISICAQDEPITATQLKQNERRRGRYQHKDGGSKKRNRDGNKANSKIDKRKKEREHRTPGDISSVDSRLCYQTDQWTLPHVLQSPPHCRVKRRQASVLPLPPSE